VRGTIYFVPIKWNVCLRGKPRVSVIQCASAVKLLNVLRGNMIYCVSAQRSFGTNLWSYDTAAECRWRTWSKDTNNMCV